MRLLVCDDDRSTRFVIKRLLAKSPDWTVVDCGDGRDALRLLDEERFDAVLLDIEMPRVDGVEVLEGIRNSAATRDLPVVMLSRERREQIVRRLIALGISGYILKPVRLDRLAAALDPLCRPMAARARQPSGR